MRSIQKNYNSQPIIMALGNPRACFVRGENLS